LAAKLNVFDGTVIDRNMQRPSHQEFIRFLKRHPKARFPPAKSST
jgi:hypothetical protein